MSTAGLHNSTTARAEGEPTAGGNHAELATPLEEQGLTITQLNTFIKAASLVAPAKHQPSIYLQHNFLL